LRKSKSPANGDDDDDDGGVNDVDDDDDDDGDDGEGNASGTINGGGCSAHTPSATTSKS
jgi:hypothetical protein